MNVPPSERKETFLARYPRKLKLAVTGCLLLVLLSPFLVPSRDGSEAERPDTAVNSPSEPAGPITSSPAADTRPSDPQAMSLNDTDDLGARMARAPDDSLTEETGEGPLPKIGVDGRKPWQVYARPFNNADRRPRIAIVITDVGLLSGVSDAALRRLPGSVTLAFDAQSPAVGAWLERARQDGHETLLSVPMEPFDYPHSDPGPNTLLTNVPDGDNLRRLSLALRRGTGYVGITTLSGSRFTTTPDKLTPVLEALRDRGLMVFDVRVAPHSVLKDLAKQIKVPVAASTQRIDRNPAPEAIDSALDQLEQTARLNGRAVGVASSLPVTLDRLEPWIKGLPSRGIALAPLSAVVE